MLFWLKLCHSETPRPCDFWGNSGRRCLRLFVYDCFFLSSLFSPRGPVARRMGQANSNTSFKISVHTPQPSFSVHTPPRPRRMVREPSVNLYCRRWGGCTTVAGLSFPHVHVGRLRQAFRHQQLRPRPPGFRPSRVLASVHYTRYGRMPHARRILFCPIASQFTITGTQYCVSTRPLGWQRMWAGKLRPARRAGQSAFRSRLLRNQFLLCGIPLGTS